MLLFWLQIFSLGWVQLKSMPTVGLRRKVTFPCQGLEEMLPQEIFMEMSLALGKCFPEPFFIAHVNISLKCEWLRVHTTMLYYYRTTSTIETDSFHWPVSL